MNLINLLTFFVGFSTVITPLILLKKNPRLYRNKLLLLLAIVSGPLWALSIIFFYEADTLEFSLISLNSIYTVSVLTAVITFEFTRIFPFRDKVEIYEKLFLILPSLFFLYEIWIGNTFINKVEFVASEKVPTLGLSYLLWFIWFGSIICWRIIILSKKLKSINEIAKKQTFYIIGGLAIAGLGMLPTNMILPYLGNYRYVWVGPFMGAIMVTVIAYAISTLRFFNVKKIYKSVVNLFLIYFLPALLISFLTNNLFLSEETVLGWEHTIVNALIIIVSFFVIEDIRSRLTSKKIPLKEAVSKITESKLYMEDICGLIQRISNESLNITGTSFIISSSGKTAFRYWGEGMSYEGDIPIVELLSYGSYYEDQEKIIILQELKHLQLISMEEQNIWRYKRFLYLINFFERSNINIVVPIYLRNENIVFVCFGPKKDNDLFQKEEIEEIQDMKSAIKIIFERSLLYQEVEQFNKTLQQKVNQQTEELQIKVRQLQEARKKERDMIDIMGHELRTPATVVKLNAELLEQFTDDVLNDRDKFGLYVKRIKSAVDNEIKLINTLLSSAKLEGDKIELNSEKINVVEEIEMAIHGNEVDAKEKGLKLINNVAQDTPEIYADHARLIEVLNNLVSNAVKYTEKGSIKISSSNTEDNVSISVQDTGKGIAKDELSKLGQKFYRIQNYIDEREGKPDLVRPGGTGLGLYVTFGLVEKMGGKMDVESEVGKGTKFTFSLPRYKNQDNGIEKLHSKDMFERLGLKR